MEKFHDEQVNSIKCQSHNLAHGDAGSDVRPEELYIQYPKCVVVLSGMQLFSTLRNLRSQLARGLFIYQLNEQMVKQIYLIEFNFFFLY